MHDTLENEKKNISYLNTMHEGAFAVLYSKDYLIRTLDELNRIMHTYLL